MFLCADEIGPRIGPYYPKGSKQPMPDPYVEAYKSDGMSISSAAQANSKHTAAPLMQLRLPGSAANKCLSAGILPREICQDLLPFTSFRARVTLLEHNERLWWHGQNPAEQSYLQKEAPLSPKDHPVKQAWRMVCSPPLCTGIRSVPPTQPVSSNCTGNFSSRTQ